MIPEAPEADRGIAAGPTYHPAPMQAQLETSDPAPRRVLAGFALAWLAFWLLMMLVGVQDNARSDGHDPWRPLAAR